MRRSRILFSVTLAFMTMESCSSSVGERGTNVTIRRLAGAWSLIVSLDTPYGYSVVKADDTRIESSIPDTISFRTTVSAASGPFGQSSQYTFGCTLRYDSPSQTYLLSVQKDGVGYVENLPMKYSDATGLVGTLARTLKGKEVTSEGKITFKSDGGHEWVVCQATPCEEGLSKPGHALTFTFSKPSPKQ